MDALGSIARGPGFGHNRRAPYRSERIARSPRRSLALLLARLAATGVRSGRVLEIDPGEGHLLRALELAGYEVAGLESSPETLARCAATAAREGRAPELRLGDVCRGIPWDTATFDAVVLRDVVERLADPYGAVAELLRVLRPGGFAIVRTANGGGLLARLLGSRWSFYRDADRLRPYDLPSLVALFGYGGFRIHAWDTHFDLARAGEVSPLLAPLRRLPVVLPSFGLGLGETALLVAQKPKLPLP